MKMIDRKWDLLDILMIISIVFIGSDIWSFEIKGITVRFIQMFYVFFVLVLILKRKYCMFYNKTILAFASFFLLTCVLSVSFSLSISFFIWIVFNIFFIVFLFSSYIREKGSKAFIEIFRISMWIILICCLVSFIISYCTGYEFSFLTYQKHKGIIRTSLWFYEPSYLATFLSIWLGFSSYKLIYTKEKKYILDLLGAIVAIFTTTSTTGFISIALILLFIYIGFVIKTPKKETKIKYLVIGAMICVAGFGIIYYMLPNVYEIFVARIFKDGLSVSSGNRIKNYGRALDIFNNNILTGVGPNCYGFVLGDPLRQPTNVTLELLATIGLIGALLFYIMYFFPIIKSMSKKGSNEAAFAFSALFFILLLQANQNYMRLYLWMLIGIMYGCLAYRKEENYKCLYF